MASKDEDGRIVETLEDATSSENSPDTLIILIVSLVALVLIGAAFAWYFGYAAKMFS
jgi:cytochrome bd-type quinol oxidase subunit 2